MAEFAAGGDGTAARTELRHSFSSAHSWLSHLFAAPLVREEMSKTGIVQGLVGLPELDYEPERAVIRSALAAAGRTVPFRSLVATNHNFLRSLTESRVMHLACHGHQDMLGFEDEYGRLQSITQDQLRSMMYKKDCIPELVVVSSCCAHSVGQAFVDAGIQHVISIAQVPGARYEAGDKDPALRFLEGLYSALLKGDSIQGAFQKGVDRSATSTGGGSGGFAVPPLPQLSTRLSSTSVGSHTDLRWETSEAAQSMERFVLLPRERSHTEAPFSDLGPGQYADLSPSLSEGRCEPVSSHFLGRSREVHDVFRHLAGGHRVISIVGRPGAGKTQIALRACAYARERERFSKIFFVRLNHRRDEGSGSWHRCFSGDLVPMGSPTSRGGGAGRGVRGSADGKAPSSAEEVAEHIARAFGLRHVSYSGTSGKFEEGLLRSIREVCQDPHGHYLAVLDGVSTWLVKDPRHPELLSSFVEQLCASVRGLQVIVTSRKELPIHGHKVVKVGPLHPLSAAELFIRCCPRPLSNLELWGGSPQDEMDKIRVFSGSEIIRALEGHPSTVVAVSLRAAENNLLLMAVELEEKAQAHLREIDAEERREMQEDEDMSREVEDANAGPPPALRSMQSIYARPSQSDEEAAAQAAGEAVWASTSDKFSGTQEMSLPWEKLCNLGVCPYFETVLGPQGRARPLSQEDREFLGSSWKVWRPCTPPAFTSGMVHRTDFLQSFWPWISAVAVLLAKTDLWAPGPDPAVKVIWDLHKEHADVERLLLDQTGGTFLLRVSAEYRQLVICYRSTVERKIRKVLVGVTRTDSSFTLALHDGITLRASSMRSLLRQITSLRFLYPTVPKEEALAG